MTERTDTGRHVVIVGGGFGGLTAAQALARTRVRVTLVDRTNHHTFQPLLYQVATAGLSAADIAQPIRSILRRQRNATVLLGEVSRIDLEGKRLYLSDGGRLEWDFLVLACGADTSYFGHDDWREVAPGLKSLEDAFDVRTRVLLAFELAEREADTAKRQALLNFVVIGGGPTGVELAGALSELSRFALGRDFRRVNPTVAKVLLLEAGPHILPSFPEDLADSATRQLRELGVEVRTGAFVIGMEPGIVRLKDGPIPCSVALWAAGVRTNPLTKTLGVALDRQGRVIVEEDLRIPGHPSVFVIGDAAHALDAKGTPLPGVSPVALQEGRAVASSIRRILDGKAAEPFAYYDKGQMATVGRRRAIATIGKLHLSGVVAWFAWLLVHIIYLIGFKNRVVVLITWAWSYFTYKHGARLITGDQRQLDLALRIATEGMEHTQAAEEMEPAPARAEDGQARAHA